MSEPSDFAAFRTLSAALGQNPLRVQGPGGNTSLKEDGTMWIKASGTELADADRSKVFVAVDHAAARAEAYETAGDGSCKATVLDASHGLRPSIETTFHAALQWRVVLHTHSIATLVHAVSPQGIDAAREKLAGLPAAFVPYAKPGLPLTREILACVTPETQVFVLQNHGLIVCANDVEAAAALMETVEIQLNMPARDTAILPITAPAPETFDWAVESWLALDARARQLATEGSYYPDHVVFLGPGLPRADHAGMPAAIVRDGQGVALRSGATASQRAMLRCLSDLLSRLPADWEPTAIGPQAEAELLDWDAEKYRQALAARS